MNELLSKVSAYDQLGFVVVGGLFYAFFDYDLSYFDLDLKRITENAFGIGVAVYFLGHLAQAIANQFIKEKKDSFSESDKKLLAEVKNIFNINECPDHEAFGVCYLWSLTADKTGHVEVMNARYGLYRGWFVVLGLQAAFYLFIIIRDSIDCKYFLKNFIGIVFTIGACYLIKKRSRRFFLQISGKTFQTFILNRKALLENLPQKS